MADIPLVDPKKPLKVTTAPKTIIQAISPTSQGAKAGASAVGALAAIGKVLYNTRKENSDVRKAKGIDLGVKVVGNAVGLSGKSTANIANLIKSGGSDKNAAKGLALSALDRISGKNISGLVDAVSGSDVFDALDRKKEPKYVPPGQVLKGIIPSDPHAADLDAAKHIVSMSNATTPNSMLVKMANRLDPLFSLDWRVTLPAFDKFGFQSSEISEDTFQWYVEEVNITPRNIAQESVFRRGSQVHYPGWIDTGSLSIVFYEDNRMNAYRYIEKWQSKIRNPQTGLYYLPSSYKFPILIDCLDVYGNVIGSLRALGCWPTTRQALPLQSASSDPVKLSIDFSTDGVEFVPGAITQTEPTKRNTIDTTKSLFYDIDTGSAGGNRGSMFDFMLSVAGVKRDAGSKLKKARDLVNKVKGFSV